MFDITLQAASWLAVASFWVPWLFFMIREASYRLANFKVILCQNNYLNFDIRIQRVSIDTQCPLGRFQGLCQSPLFCLEAGGITWTGALESGQTLRADTAVASFWVPWLFFMIREVLYRLANFKVILCQNNYLNFNIRIQRVSIDTQCPLGRFQGLCQSPQFCLEAGGITWTGALESGQTLRADTATSLARQRTPARPAGLAYSSHVLNCSWGVGGAFFSIYLIVYNMTQVLCSSLCTSKCLL